MEERTLPYRNAKGILAVVRDGLCHRCGACVAFCPSGTLAADASGYPVEVGKCVQCNRCVKACSGVGVDYQALGERLFGKGYRYGDPLGERRGTYVGFCRDEEIRWRGASGGVVTGLLAHLLERGEIRGALVCTADPADPVMGRGVIARTREELILSAGSYYTTSPTLAALRGLKKEEGPFAAVVVPCQAHALRKAFASERKMARRVALVVGLFCHTKVDHACWRRLARIKSVRGEEVRSIRHRRKDEKGWPHNTVEVEYSSGRRWRSPMSATESLNVLTRISPLGRCLTCLDLTCEFADLAVGDPWLLDGEGNWKYGEPGGHSTVIVRTNAGERALASAREGGALQLAELRGTEIRRGQRSVLDEKKNRVPFRLKVMSLVGRPVPLYPMEFPSWNGSTLRKEAIFLALRVLPAITPLRDLLQRILFTPFGGRIMALRTAHKKRREAARGGRLP